MVHSIAWSSPRHLETISILTDIKGCMAYRSKFKSLGRKTVQMKVLRLVSERRVYVVTKIPRAGITREVRHNLHAAGAQQGIIRFTEQSCE